MPPKKAAKAKEKSAVKPPTTRATRSTTARNPSQEFVELTAPTRRRSATASSVKSTTRSVASASVTSESAETRSKSKGKGRPKKATKSPSSKVVKDANYGRALRRRFTIEIPAQKIREEEELAALSNIQPYSPSQPKTPTVMGPTSPDGTANAAQTAAASPRSLSSMLSPMGFASGIWSGMRKILSPVAPSLMQQKSSAPSNAIARIPALSPITEESPKQESPTIARESRKRKNSVVDDQPVLKKPKFKEPNHAELEDDTAHFAAPSTPRNTTHSTTPKSKRATTPGTSRAKTPGSTREITPGITRISRKRGISVSEEQEESSYKRMKVNDSDTPQSSSAPVAPETPKTANKTPAQTPTRRSAKSVRAARSIASAKAKAEADRSHLIPYVPKEADEELPTELPLESPSKLQPSRRATGVFRVPDGSESPEERPEIPSVLDIMHQKEVANAADFGNFVDGRSAPPDAAKKMVRVRVDDLAAIPSRRPGQSTGTFALLDEFFDSDEDSIEIDEDLAEMAGVGVSHKAVAGPNVFATAESFGSGDSPASTRKSKDAPSSMFGTSTTPKAKTANVFDSTAPISSSRDSFDQSVPASNDVAVIDGEGLNAFGQQDDALQRKRSEAEKYKPAVGSRLREMQRLSSISTLYSNPSTPHTSGVNRHTDASFYSDIPEEAEETPSTNAIFPPFSAPPNASFSAQTTSFFGGSPSKTPSAGTLSAPRTLAPADSAESQQIAGNSVFQIAPSPEKSPQRQLSPVRDNSRAVTSSPTLAAAQRKAKSTADSDETISGDEEPGDELWPFPSGDPLLDLFTVAEIEEANAYDPTEEELQADMAKLRKDYESFVASGGLDMSIDELMSA